MFYDVKLKGRIMNNVQLYFCGGCYYDIVYSPDDGGYYLQRHIDDATSVVYKDKDKLLNDLHKDNIIFEK
jgi:hypothetical protein